MQHEKDFSWKIIYIKCVGEPRPRPFSKKLKFSILGQ